MVPAMPLIDTSQLPLVAFAEMNDVHVEEVGIVNELSDLLDAYSGDESQIGPIAAKFTELVEHTKEHFANEERLMTETAFPPFPVHKGEHDMQLSRVASLVAEWERTKNVDLLKAFIQVELPQWVVNHIQTMDAVTAMHINATRG